MSDRQPLETVQKKSREISRIRGKESGNPSALRRRPVACLWAAALFLVWVILSGSQLGAQEPEKQAYDTFHCGDGHWAYTYEKDISDRCLDCKQPVNKSSEACSLWRSAQDCIENSNCPHCDKSYTKSYGAVLFDKDSKDPKIRECHWLVVPSDPVIGVEDLKRRETHNYWYDAWLAATTVIKPKILPTTDIGLAINPATGRGQHQLHIHIGRLPNDLRNTLNRQNIHRYPLWKQITVSTYNKITGKTTPHTGCYATFITPKDYLPGEKFPAPFSQRDTTQVKEHNMPHYGIIVASQKDTEKEKGFYVCYCKDTSVEYALDYRCQQR